MTRRFLLGVLALNTTIACAQVPPAPQQIAAAVLAAPKELRHDATVLGYSADGKLTTLRKGTGPMVCLASNPGEKQFHVACYHQSLEPFMARGRFLRANGVPEKNVDSVRFDEVRAGTLAMPPNAAMLYSLTGPAGSFAPPPAPRRRRNRCSWYLPNATVASTGLSATPVEGAPWIMDPGTPKARIMLESGMSGTAGVSRAGVFRYDSIVNPRSRHTILVVDDEEPVRRMTCRMLRDLGYKALEAGDGKDALLLWERIATEHPSLRPRIALVIADVRMPEMDGVELAQHIACSRTRLPCSSCPPSWRFQAARAVPAQAVRRGPAGQSLDRPAGG